MDILSEVIRDDLECPGCDEPDIIQLSHIERFWEGGYTATFLCKHCRYKFKIEQYLEMDSMEDYDDEYYMNRFEYYEDLDNPRVALEFEAWIFRQGISQYQDPVDMMNLQDEFAAESAHYDYMIRKDLTEMLRKATKWEYHTPNKRWF